MIHRNSIQSFHEIRDKLAGKHQTIWDAFRSAVQDNLTDRMVKDMLGYQDMNSVRPRITELVKNGYLIEVDRAKCPVTGKKVRVCQIANNRGYNNPDGQLEGQLDLMAANGRWI